MESTWNASRPVPWWIRKLMDIKWYEWLAWMVEIAMIGAFGLIAYDQFAEGLSQAGWLMVLISIIFFGPGLWLLIRYKPQLGSPFGRLDIEAIVCFAIWVALLGYFLLWSVNFQPGFGNRF